MVGSPDGRIELEFRLDGSGAPRYRVRFSGTSVLEESRVGLVRDDADFSTGLRLGGASEERVGAAVGTDAQVHGSLVGMMLLASSENPFGGTFRALANMAGSAPVHGQAVHVSRRAGEKWRRVHRSRTMNI